MANKKTKFYIGGLSAEEERMGVYELTKAEYEAIKRFCNDDTIYSQGGGWCGSAWISDESFNTAEEALDAMCKGNFMKA